MHLYWHLGHYQSFTYVCSAIDWWEPEWLPKMFRRCRISRPRTFYVSDRFLGSIVGGRRRRIICSSSHPFDLGRAHPFKCTWLFFWPNRTLVLKGRCSSFDRRYEVSWWVNFFSILAGKRMSYHYQCHLIGDPKWKITIAAQQTSGLWKWKKSSTKGLFSQTLIPNPAAAAAPSPQSNSDTLH